MTAALPTLASVPTLDRRTYVGGSSIGAIAGLDPHRTALDVWAQMTGLVGETVATPQMDAGSIFEPAIVALYAKLRGPMTVASHGTLRHPQRPWHGATPDTVRDGTINVQVKLVGIGQWGRWSTDEADGPEGIPPEKLAQVQWELYVLRACGIAPGELGHVAAMFGTELRVYPVPRDNEIIEALVEIADAFIRVNVLGGESPIITAENAETARALVSKKYPRERRGMLASTPEVERLARDYLAARDAVNKAEGERDRLAAEICTCIGDAEGVQGDWGRATWKTRASAGTDWKGLATELNPPAAMLAKYARPGGRVLDVRPIAAATKRKKG